MKLVLTDNELLDVIRYCFENGGLSELHGCDVVLQYSDELYKATRAKLKTQDKKIMVCYEDVLMQMLQDGTNISFLDHNEDKIIPLTLQSARENLDACSGEEIEEVVMIVKEDPSADAWTAFNVLQYMLFKEIIYS